MLNFKPVTQRELTKLRFYYENCGYRLCEYSAGVKLMWRERLHPHYAEAAGCLLICNRIEGAFCFDYPVAGPEGDEDAALAALEDYCVEQGLALRLSVVPEEKTARLLARYPQFHVTNLRAWSDYLYEAESLREFPGRRYSGQRNHVNRFTRAYPDARFRVLGGGAEDRARIERFWEDYESVFNREDIGAKRELRYAKRLLKLAGKSCFCVGGLERGGRLISLCLAERCGDTLIDHVEKALYQYDGVYPATVQAFARAFACNGVRWLNREDDAANRGLRTSKQQYLPAAMGDKYCFDVGNGLEELDAIPVLRTKRLTLSALTEADREAYNALCLDDARNRWWGYDYRADWRGEKLSTYFLHVAQEDFRRRLAVNFAVRLDGQCMGEAVLYRFDFRGGAELGCRIAPEYAGHGYGTEAFAAAADWALYQLRLRHVVAKCYRENDASFRMLSSCMRKSGEDATFFYFDKIV